MIRSYFFLFVLILSGAVLQGQNADVYIMTGNAMEELGDLKGALNQYNLAVEDDSTYAMAYFNRAYVKRKLDDYAGAIDDYTQAIKYNPKYGVAYNNRGIVYILLGRKDDACMDWEKAREFGSETAPQLLKDYCYTNSDVKIDMEE